MEKPDKRILLIIPNMSYGGAQTSFSKFSISLAQKYKVFNVVFNKDGWAGLPLGGSLIDLKINGSSSILGKALQFLKRVIAIKKIKKEKRIDVAISFLEGADYVNVLSRRSEKVILGIRGSKTFDQNISGWLGRLRMHVLIPWLYRKADHIVTVNEGIAREMIRAVNRPSKIIVIPNYYDIAMISRMSREPVEPFLEQMYTQYKVICIAGRLAPEKGFDRFLQVFTELKNLIQGVRLIIIGDGQLKMDLHNSAISLGLNVTDSANVEADVYFLGYQPNPHKYIARSKVFVLPSIHEGFPNVLVEAMCLGVSVVASDCPYGPREILIEPDGEFAGILLPIISPSVKSEWLANLQDILMDEARQRRLCKRALTIVEQKYTEDISMQKWNAIIEQ